MTLEQLKVVLMALLPGGGSLVATSELAMHTCTSGREVMDALKPEVYAGRVHYDVRTDAFAVIKKGDAL